MSGREYASKKQGMENNTTIPELERAAVLLQSGRGAEAEAIALRVAASDPASARAWFLTGVARHQQERPETALAAMERALSLDPAMDDARQACATLLLGLKRPRAALVQIEELSRRRPGDVKAAVDAAIVLEELGDLPAALAGYDEALRRDQRDFRARLNRGALLARLGRLDEALRDDQALVRSHIGSAAAHYNLADVLLRLDRYAEALIVADRALRLAPADANVLMLRGLALAMLGRDTESGESFSRARTADAAGARRFLDSAASVVGLGEARTLTEDPRQIRLARLLERQKSCDWAERDRLVQGMRQLATELQHAPGQLDEMGLYFTSLSLPLAAAEQQALAQGIAMAASARAVGNPLSPHDIWRGGEGKRRPGKIRLGFLSPDFREHPAAQLHWRQLAGHDRGTFEVFGYSIHRGDGSELRMRIEEACDAFREVSALNAQELAARIALDDIDILVDLAGYTDFSRPEVLALRPAPLQVSYLGMPATMGSRFIDYRITDAFTTSPEEAVRWTEKLAYLPDTFFIYNDREMIAEATTGRKKCGLPESGLVFCCFNSSYKIEPEAFDVWMRLLHRIPDSVLWLVDSGEPLRNNLQREAAARGIRPARLVFAPRLPRAEHLARHACADLFLDAFHCNAHTTAADALWAGLPVLTCPGRTMASRIGASIVRAAGLPELVATDRAAYGETAFRLATQPDELATLRTRLARNRSTCSLFDTARRVRELDRAFQMMWERHAAGLPPASFAVPRSEAAQA
ncbi:MAG: tetratricopeptide repeat protein [Rhodocyclales bacterium]|nr:tetratricopeptide repeat protein [Rhodocyclales bacterium]